MATPFHDLCPRQMAPYPAFLIGATGNSESFQFLKARNIRLGSAQPTQQIGESLFYVIYIEGSDFQAATVGAIRLLQHSRENLQPILKIYVGP
jgi:hypothetical protein